MKKLSYFLVVFYLTLMSCNKDSDAENKDKDIIIGGIYQSYTEMITSKVNTQFTINDINSKFNNLEAGLFSHLPTSHQNCFFISLIDTSLQPGTAISIQIYTPLMKPEDFFRKGSFNIDTLRISHFKSGGNFTDEITGADAVFAWDTVYFDNLRFKGKGSLEITKKADGPFLSGDFYPVQKLELEFK